MKRIVLRKLSLLRLKFPVFEIINMAMTFTAFSSGVSNLANRLV